MQTKAELVANVAAEQSRATRAASSARMNPLPKLIAGGIIGLIALVVVWDLSSLFSRMRWRL